METPELILSVVALLIVGAGVFTFLYLKYIKTQGKTTKKTVKNQLETVAAEQIRELQEMYQGKIVFLQEHNAELTKINKSLQNAVNRYKGIHKNDEQESNDEDDNDDNFQNQYEIVPEKAIEYAQKLNLNVGALNNPALQGLVWEKIKEHEDIALMLGIIRPKSGLVNAIAPQSPAPANSTEALLAELSKAGRFA